MEGQLKRQWEILKIIPIPPNKPKSTEAIRQELCEKTGEKIVKRTVERDLVALSKEFDIQCNTKGRTNFWSWVDVPSMWLPGLSKEQALAFFMVQKNLKSLLPEATLHSLDPFFRGAENTLASSPQKVRSWTQKFRLIESRQVLIPPEVNGDAARVVRNALLFDKVITVTWLDRTGEKEFRATLLPLAIVQRGAVLFLIYRDLADCGNKFIQMHRIQRAQTSLEKCPPGIVFDIDTFIESGQLGFGRQYPIRLGQTLELQALFSKRTAERLCETPVSEDQVVMPGGNGRMKLTASVKFSGELLWWLLSYGASVEVLEPLELRQLLAKATQDAARQYAGSRRSPTQTLNDFSQHKNRSLKTMPQNPIQEMYRLASAGVDPNRKHTPHAAPRPPGNVPYVVDNLWEWQRPEGYPSRRHCVCASPSVALAQKYGGAADGQVYRVRQLDGARIAQVELEDAKLHQDAGRLHRKLLELLGGGQWLAQDVAGRAALAPLWMPCLTSAEVESLFTNVPELAAIRDELVPHITFWNDVQPVSLNSPWPFENGEIFFEAASWHLV